MAVVTAEERRILRDYFGYTDDMVDGLSEYAAGRQLDAYHSQQETGFYSTAGAYTGPTPAEAQEDWVTQGLAATAVDVASGVQATGEAAFTTARQVGTGIAEAVGVTSGLLKYLVPAGIILAGYLVYLRFKG
jgi:hypothetical protein